MACNNWACNDPAGHPGSIGDTASDNERKVMAGYFDKSGSLQRFARYVLKDGKIIDEIGNAELTEGQEVLAVRLLLTNQNSTTNGLGAPSVTSTSSQ